MRGARAATFLVYVSPWPICCFRWMGWDGAVFPTISTSYDCVVEIIFQVSIPNGTKSQWKWAVNESVIDKDSQLQHGRTPKNSDFAERTVEYSGFKLYG